MVPLIFYCLITANDKKLCIESITTFLKFLKATEQNYLRESLYF